MLRVNLLADEAFRKDVLDVARGILREIGREVVAEAVGKAGWLEARVDAYFQRNPVENIFAKWMRSYDYAATGMRKLIDDAVKRRFDETMPGFERRLREIVAEELKQRTVKVSFN